MMPSEMGTTNHSPAEGSAADRDHTLQPEFQLSLVRAIKEVAPDGLLVVDGDGRVVTHNQRFLEVWGIADELLFETQGRSLIGTVDHSVLELALSRVRACDRDAFLARVHALYADPAQVDACEIELADGRTLQRHSTGLVGERGNYLGRVWFFRDVTHQKKTEAALRDLAEHDPLTGVANRRLFFQRATLELARVRRTQRPAALVSIDIDHFKRVNDLHGHAAGDEVLKMLSRRCSSLLREVDLFARVGGEEFAVLLPETTLAEARGLVDRLREAVAEAFVEVDGQRIGCTFSAGVAALHPDGDVDACLRRADDLLYRAKHLGRNRVEVDA